MDIYHAQNLLIFANNPEKYVLIGVLKMGYALEVFATACQATMEPIVQKLSALLANTMTKLDQSALHLALQEHTLINIQSLAWYVLPLVSNVEINQLSALDA